ncbi:FadR/GntR family transcriptional regulator [Aestuariivirga sp.]|uniref:FadR/GntR family transcriptional regulator n=1 Tax=Aestuariivirga sp. TaxID=2650926 RepID=UPI0039E2EBCE
MTKGEADPPAHAAAKTPAAEEIAQHLVVLIRDGTIPSGTKLPTEQTLSRQFHVSRTVVREAISRLKSDGLVESRQGSGVSVIPPSLRKSFKLHEAVLGHQQVIDLLELRQPLEMASAQLAAVRHTTEDLEHIGSALQRMIESSDWSEEGLQADLDFHHAIAKATGNSFYADFMAFLGGALRAAIVTARSESNNPDIKSITVQEHQKILEAIEARDAGAAGHAMLLHLRGATQRMTEN